MVKRYETDFLNVYNLGSNLSLISFADRLSSSEFVKRNIYAILTNLVWRESVSVSRSRKTYKNDKWPVWYKYSDSLRAQDILIESGYVIKSKGHTGVSTKLTRTEQLENLLKNINFEVYKQDTNSLYILTLDREPIDDNLNELKNKFTLPVTYEVLDNSRKSINSLNDENYLGGVSLGFNRTTTLFDLQKFVSNVNSKRSISMAENVFLTGMFSSKGSGRLYCRYPSYQYIPKKLRSHLTINGFETSENDFAGMHVNLLYYILGKQNPNIEDPYIIVTDELKITGNLELREAIKKLIIIAINCEFDELKTKKAFTYNNYSLLKKLNEADINIEHAFNVVKKNMMIDDIKSDFDIHKLFFHESQIMLNIMTALRLNGIVGLPLFDAVISTPQHHLDVVTIMNEEYQRYTGYNISVK